jgi:AcrR family transcriptional regulator
VPETQRKRSRAYLARREEMLNIAARLINSEGLASATLSAVADVLGVRHNTLYHYFGDREDLRRTVLERTVALREASLEQAMAQPGSALEKVLAYLEIELDAPFNSRVDTSGGRGLEPAERDRFMRLKSGLTGSFAALIRSGIADGSIAPCDPVVRAFALESIVNRFIVHDRQTEEGLAGTRLANVLLDILRNGLLQPRRQMPNPPSDARGISTILGLEFDREDELGLELHRLLGNATLAFNQEGWEASIPEMAARYGKSKTVYYQFAADKQELLFHCLSRGIGLIEASQLASAAAGSNPAECIVLHYRYLYRAHDSEAGPFPVFNEMDRLHPHHRRIIAIRNRTVRYRSQQRVAAGINAGWFRMVPAAVVQPCFGGMLYRLGLGIDERPRSMSLEDVAIENLRLMFQGLKAE